MKIPAASSSAIADVLALRGQSGWLTPPLAPIVAARCPVIGEVVTVQIERRDIGADFKPMYEVLSAVQSGKVLVIAGAVEVGGAIWGEILTASAQQAGFVGVAIDGFVRDIAAMQNLDLPVYASGTAVVGPLGRAHVVSVGETVNIFGQEVSSGDQIVLDDSGCVRLASSDAQEILEAAALYEKGEEQVLVALAAGERLNSAYRYKADVVSRLKR